MKIKDFLLQKDINLYKFEKVIMLLKIGNNMFYVASESGIPLDIVKEIYLNFFDLKDHSIPGCGMHNGERKYWDNESEMDVPDYDKAIVDGDELLIMDWIKEEELSFKVFKN